MTRPIQKDASQNFGQHVHRFGAVSILVVYFVFCGQRFDHVQGLHNTNPARTRWGRADNFETVEGANDWLSNFGLVGIKVGLPNHAICFFHFGDQHICKSTFVKCIGTLVSDLLKRCSKLRQLHRIAGHPFSTARFPINFMQLSEIWLAKR